MNVKGYAAESAGKSLAPYSFVRREVGVRDVLIKIKYCGVCHSDIHQVRDEWSKGIFPMVPGHEIVGMVVQVGREVTKFRIGDYAGVGCLVDSCRSCYCCKLGEEQYCESGAAGTYNSYEMDRKTPTYGGYSDNIVVNEDFILHIANNLNLSRVAPLLCAGITTYSPLKQWKVGKGHRVAVLGLGGLGHMAVKLAASMGAEVTVLSTSPEKEADAKRLGAHNFVVSQNLDEIKKVRNYFDFILNTVSASIDLNPYLNLLRLDGTMILLGISPEDPVINSFGLIGKRRRLAGSLIGGITETQEMLDYCAGNDIMADVEILPIVDINTAYERMIKGDVKYRFVIDMTTL